LPPSKASIHQLKKIPKLKRLKFCRVIGFLFIHEVLHLDGFASESIITIDPSSINGPYKLLLN